MNTVVTVQWDTMSVVKVLQQSPTVTMEPQVSVTATLWQLHGWGACLQPAV